MDLFDAVKQSTQTPLVNQSFSSGDGSDLFDAINPRQPEPLAPKTPDSYFGEFTSSVSRGTDELQQMLYGGGALAASWLGAEGMKDWFIKGYLGNEKEIQANPASVNSYQDVDGFDKGFRYALAATGEFVPMMAESLVTGWIGATIGTAAEPGGGTIAGGLGGIIGRKAVRNLMRDEVRPLVTPLIRNELTSYLDGTLAKSALSKGAKDLLSKETKSVAEKYGADAAIALSSIAKEAGGIYGDLLADPNISESDRRNAATVGGIIAAIPDTFVQGWLVKKFFPGNAAPAKEEVAAANGYLTRFLTKGVPEMAKVAGAEGGQEFIQTAVELAAKNWADPAKRYDFLNYSPEQWQEMTEAGIRGAIGGGIVGSGVEYAAHLVNHPDPQVRADMRDVFTKSDDVAIEIDPAQPIHHELTATIDRQEHLQREIDSGNLTPELVTSHQFEIQQLATRENDLREQMGLTEEDTKASTPNEPLVNQSETAPKEPKVDENIPNPLSVPDQTKIDDLRALYAQEMPSGEASTGGIELDAEKVAAKQQEINDHIDVHHGGTEFGEKLKAAFDPGLVRMMANEDVSIATDTSEKSSKLDYAATIDSNGKIELHIPDANYSQTAAKDYAKVHGITEAAGATIVSDPAIALAHEEAHIADFINLRSEWKDSGSQDSLTEFVDNRMETRGASFRAAMPTIAKAAGIIYFQSASAPELSNVQLGQEIPRMAVEMARQGKTSEVTEALITAAEKGNKIDLFLRTWIDALKNIGQTIRKFLDPKTANPELLKAYHDIQNTLNKYDPLVNQKLSELDKLEAVQKEQRAFLEKTYPENPAPEPKVETLPAQQVEQAKPIKAQTDKQAALSDFRASLKNEGPSDNVRAYLAWQDARKNLPISNADVKEAYLDFSNRAPKATMNIERFKQLTKEYVKTKTTQSQPAKKPSVLGGTESESGHEADLPSNLGATGGYHHPVIAGIAQETKEAPAGQRVAAIRQQLSEKMPEMVPHLDNIVKEIETNQPDFGAINRLRDTPSFIRGSPTADFIQQNPHAIYIGFPVKELSKTLASHRGLQLFGLNEEIPNDRYLIDTQGVSNVLADVGVSEEDAPLVNQNASVIWPVELTDKLKEAQAMDGIPETHALFAFGRDEITPELVQAFDEHFGENKWIVKYYGEDTGKSQGVYFAEKVKLHLDQDPLTFTRFNNSQLMVQELHDVIPSDRASNIKILPGRELRVHVLTDEDGNARILPFATFWKPALGEANVDNVSRITPLTVENSEIRAAHERALSSVESIPIEDRSGQFFGMDIVKLADGSWGTIEGNATYADGQSGLFAGNPLSHDAYMAALLGEHPVHAELARLTHGAMEADSVLPLVNQSQPALKPTLGRDAQRRYDNLVKETEQTFENTFEPNALRQARSVTKERGGAGDYDHMTAAAMEYKSQPQALAAIRAQAVMSEHGLENIIQLLKNEPLATSLKLNEADEIAGVPNATLTALYNNATQQLNSMIKALDADGRDRKVKSWLQEEFRALEYNIRHIVTPIGRATAMSGMIDKVWNAGVALREYIQPLIGHLQKVLGKPGARFISEMSKRLNGLMSDYADKAASRAETLAQLEKIVKLSHTKKFQDEARKTYVMTEKRARSIVKRMAARMAEHEAMDEQSDAYVNEMTKRSLRKMTGLPRAAEAKTELQLFTEAVNDVVSDNAREAGLIPEPIKNTAKTEDKLATIIKNDDLYRQFVGTLQRNMIEEYKPEPNTPFAHQVEEFGNWMVDKSWSQSMVDSLVNQNLRTYETTFAKIAREHYGLSDFRVENFRESVRQAMLERGVENEGLLNRLVDDAEGAMRSRIEEGRLNFLGSGSGVGAFLKNAQTNLAEKAKEHASASADIPEQLHEWLAEDFGIPDTKEMPLASALQQVMMRQYDSMLADKRAEIVRSMVEKATADKSETVKKQALSGVERILQLAHLGVMSDATAYAALAPKFGLPKYSPEIAKQVMDYGDKVANAQNVRLKNEALQDLSSLIASQKGISPYDMFLSGLYVNMLSGVSTHAVNVFSNTASLGGYLATAATQDLIQNRGVHIPAMLRALFRTAVGSAASEMKETFFSGHSLHSSGEKFFPVDNLLEMENPVFNSPYKVANKFAEMEHKLYRKLGGKWVGRALNAVDVYFYKMAEEAAFAVKGGQVETHAMRSSAMMEAEKQMIAQGLDTTTRAGKRKQYVLANQIVNEQRLVNQNDRIAWEEARHEALDATFRQDPRGLLGRAAKFIEQWTKGESKDGVTVSPNPIGRLLIPFTRIAANVTNQMLEWTPYGLIRYGAGHKFGEDFRLQDEGGNPIGRDPKVLIRASLGTLGGMALMALFGQDADKDDPWAAVYDDGSKNPEKRRQMMDMGWRPKTIKIGNGYYSYTGTPFSMVFSILGRTFDDYRDGVTKSPYDIGLSSSAVAMLQAVTHESFLSGLTDFMSAVDSPTPEKKISRLMARTAAAPFIPNLVKQIDKWVDPSIQQAQGFAETFMREMPVVRHQLKPSLNVFGEELNRDPGINTLPGLERFLTMAKTDDPVLNLLSESNATVPGFSKSAKLGDKVMDRDQYYDYVRTAGPLIKQAIQAELPQLRSMSKEQAQERINDLSRKVKEQVRNQMRASLVN